MNGRTYLIDHTISALPLDMDSQATADQVLTKVKGDKDLHYAGITQNTTAASVTIVPLAFSALGRLQADGLKFLNDISKALAAGDKSKHSKITKCMYETCSVAIWRGNSAILRQYHNLTKSIPRD